jgi:RimJ/RimL family protein N-acetyltransferase
MEAREPRPLPPWPLFDLVLTTPRLTLRVPTDDDLSGLLDAIDAGIHAPEEMPFSVAWTDVPPDARRLKALQHWWGARANWSADEWHLTLAVFYEGSPIGVQELFAVRFPVLKEVSTGSWLTRSVQGQGLGKEMRAAVLNLAFCGLEASYAHSGAFDDNASSTSVSRALGYRENGFRHEAPRGQARRLTNFVISREEWLARCSRFPPTDIAGLEGCRQMFEPEP